MSKKMNPSLDIVKNNFERAASKFKVRPGQVNTTQFWSVTTDITHWEVRKLGGLASLRDSMFPEKFEESGKKPKILLFDIETSPIIAYVWGLWENNVAINQIKSDWHVLSWSAKWLGSPESEVMYADQRHEKNMEDDKKILKKLWDLLDESDVVITQNGISFDQKKLNARFIMHGFNPPSSYRHIDTLRIAKKHFAFSSNKLEYLTKKLCTKYKKLSHAKFSGFELWKECLAGNMDAWNEMEIYNKHDVLSLEELYTKLSPWDNSVNFDVYSNDFSNTCSCGSKEFIKNGYAYTNIGRFQRYKCTKCGSECRDKKNLLTLDKKASLKK
jgi:hypothetical protein